MNFKTLILLGLMMAVAYPSSAEDSKHYWILDAATPLRSQPQPQAQAQGEVKVHLRTGTGFYSSKRSGDWIYMERRQGKNVLRGWVSASMVSETEVDRYFLQKQLRQAKSIADSISWFERIASIQPESTTYLKALQKAYVASGDTAKSAHIGRELRGTNPIYLARHDGDDVLVFGVIDSTGGFRNLLWYEDQQGSDDTKFAVANDSSRAIKKRALALRVAFASMAWYGCGSSTHPGMRIRQVLFPKVGPDMKKAGSFPMDVSGRATFGISLSSSSDFHSSSDWHQEVIFASRPAFRVPISGIRGSTEWDSLARYRKDLVGPLFDSSGISDLGFTALPEYGYLDIRMRGPLKYGYPAFIILPFSTHYQPLNFQEAENGVSGYQLLRLDKRGLKAFTFRSIHGGC